MYFPLGEIQIAQTRWDTRQRFFVGHPCKICLDHYLPRHGARSGTFVLQHKGTFEDGKAKVEWFVVSGSGTGELSGLRGEGGFAAGHAEQHLVTLDFDFE